MRVMTDDERRAFLMHGTRTGKLATARPDGRPHVAPIWFVLDGDAVVFMTHEETVKGRSLRRDGRLALCVDDQESPYSFVLVEGEATISDDLDELRHWATRIGGRERRDSTAVRTPQTKRQNGTSACANPDGPTVLPR